MHIQSLFDTIVSKPQVVLPLIILALSLSSEESVLVDSETSTRDEFGVGVALDGRYALVGSWLDNRPQNNSGAAYLFELSYQIGDTGPGGGIVFSVDGSGTGGLEAEPTKRPRDRVEMMRVSLPGY